jgi:DNA-binding MarR family transcriptional regulator
MRMLALAEAIAISKSGLTYQVVRLEKAGLVGREACAGDDRGVVAAITPLGAAEQRVALRMSLVFTGQLRTKREMCDRYSNVKTYY